MKVIICLTMLFTFFSLSSNSEVKTVFSNNKQLFIVSHYESLENLSDKKIITTEIDSVTNKKYYQSHYVPDSTNYVYIDSLKTIEVDSVVFVGSEDKSGVFLIKKGKFIIFLLKKGNEYSLSSHRRHHNVGSLVNIIEADINEDKTKEIILVYGNQFYYNYDIMTLSDQYSEIFCLYSRYDISKPDNSSNIFKIRDNKAYFLYKNNNGLNNSFIKYGMIDYYKKDHKDLYFRPISITTLEQWEKL